LVAAAAATVGSDKTASRRLMSTIIAHHGAVTIAVTNAPVAVVPVVAV
jgi:hypothetical protein